MKMNLTIQNAALRWVLQAPGVTHFTHTIAIHFLSVALAGAALAVPPAGPPITGGSTNAPLAAAAGTEDAALSRLTPDLKTVAINTNTPAMREAARIKADLQSLVAKIQAAVDAANIAHRGSATDYLVELNRVADLITETTQSKLGSGGELLKASVELVKAMDKKMDDLVAKSRDPKSPESADYDKLVLRLKEAKNILVSAQKMTTKCREDLVAEAEHLRRVSAFLADAAAIDAYQEAADAFAAALTETTAFTARLKASIDGLLSRTSTTARVAVE